MFLDTVFKAHSLNAALLAAGCRKKKNPAAPQVQEWQRKIKHCALMSVNKVTRHIRDYCSGNTSNDGPANLCSSCP